MSRLKTGLPISSRSETGCRYVAAEPRGRRRIAVALLAATCAIAFWGCSKPADQAATSGGSGAGAGSAATSGSNSAQKFSFLRKYAVGDKDSYTAAVDIGTTTSTTMTLTQAVTK